MALGFSIGDFRLLSQLAWEIHKTCRDAPGTFGYISVEVLSLHAILRECEESFSDHLISTAGQKCVAKILVGCRDILQDIDDGVKQHFNLRSNNNLKNVPQWKERLLSQVSTLSEFLK